MATASSSPLPPGDVLRIRIILVPLYRTCFDKSALISPPGADTRLTTADSIGTLETGTDSPVSIDSLTIASPERRTTSAGKVCKFSYARSIKSPGTSEAESSMVPAVKVVNVGLWCSEKVCLLTFRVAVHAHRAREARHFSHPFDVLGGGAFQERRQFRYSRLCACFRTHRSRFEQSRDDGDDRNDGDRKGVICGGRVSFGTLSGRCARHGPTVVVIDAPERDRKDLEDVERVQHLVHQEGADPLGFDFDRVRVKQGLAEGEVRLGREAVTERGDAGPGGVFPVPVAVR